MKSTFTPVTELEFPALYAAESGCTLLVSGMSDRTQLVGTVVHKGCTANPLGYYSTTWSTTCFKRVKGTITITCE